MPYPEQKGLKQQSIFSNMIDSDNIIEESPECTLLHDHVDDMMSGSKGASALFGIHDIVFELARKHYIMYPKMARSAFDPDIILSV